MKFIRQLTKQNAWDGFKKSYPQAMDEFCLWIDEYKLNSEYFNVVAKAYFAEPLNAKVTDKNEAPLKGPAPTLRSFRFHELPGEMQYGIFVCYLFNLLNEKKLATAGVALQVALAPKENEMEWYIVAQKVLEARENFIEAAKKIQSKIITRPSGLVDLNGKPLT